MYYSALDSLVLFPLRLHLTRERMSAFDRVSFHDLKILHLRLKFER